MMVKILLFNKCRPAEFRNVTREEVNNATEESSLSGNTYVVINPALHKTSRSGKNKPFSLNRFTF